MHRIFALSTLALLTLHAQGQVEPTNCTQTFSYANTLDELLDQFRDDDIRRNMQKASEFFWTHPDLTPEYLYAALNHEDWQIRQVICQHIWIRSRSSDGSPVKDYPITEDLIRVTIEGLCDDTTPIDRPRRRGLVYYNAQFGVSKLIPIAHEWSRELKAAMESDDPQQRLLAAYILGRAGVADAVERASQILIPHLRDNDLREDAKFCSFALGGFGPELLPYLRDAMPSADQQQRDLIGLLIVNIMDPPFTPEQRSRRAEYNTITESVLDPTQEQARASLWSWMDDL